MEYQGPFKGRLGSSLVCGGPTGNAGSCMKPQTYRIGESKAHATENLDTLQNWSALICVTLVFFLLFFFLQRGHPEEGDTELPANMTGLPNQ